jgi:hypothetical protein
MQEQGFNVDEKGLFCKQIPDCALIQKTEKAALGFKAVTGPATLLQSVLFPA